MAPGNAGWNDDRIPPPTPYRMSVQPNVRGNFDVAQNDVAVLRKLNELLQKNMDSFENIFLAKRHGERHQPSSAVASGADYMKYRSHCPSCPHGLRTWGERGTNAGVFR